MSLTGVIVARYKRHADVRDASGERVLCQTRGRKLAPVVGDEVHWERQDDGTGVVTAILPRRTELARTNSRGNREVIAANLTQLIVTTAAQPAPDWPVVDRYLAAARLLRIPAAVVFNKTDLESDAEPVNASVLTDYERAGYPVLRTSVTADSGLDGLTAVLAGQRSALVGQSGVGKSSLMNALTGRDVQSVGRLSAKGNHGRHTTSTSVLHELPSGGELVDSPGVRAYTPHITDAAELHHGFAEFANLIGSCRFSDCGHEEEPDCAIRKAVSDSRISRRRYDSYRKLLALTRTLMTGRRPR